MRFVLQVLLDHSDKNHPMVAERLAAVREAEDFLNNSAYYHDLVTARVVEFAGDRLGSTLVEMVQKRLETLKKHETIFVEQHRRADAEAVSRNQQMAEVKNLEDDVLRLRRLRDTLLERAAYMDPAPNSGSTRACVLSEPQTGRRPIGLWAIAALAFGVAMALVHVSDGWSCSTSKTAKPAEALQECRDVGAIEPIQPKT